MDFKLGHYHFYSALDNCPTCGAAPGVWCNQDQKTGNGVRMLLYETRVKNSGKYGTIGWHTFRHKYRSWLDETGAPIKVQQELMRQASIQTTMTTRCPEKQRSTLRAQAPFSYI